ncbi:MAG: 50S ribosomal protein L1 [Patescibacteria group bacterium]
MSRSERYQKIKAKVDKSKIYTLEEAVNFLKENASKKVDETVNLSIKLGIDTKKTDQLARGTVVLPHSLDKKIIIAVFVGPEKTEEAKEAGADLIGGVDLINKIKEKGSCDFDIAVAEPEMMKNLSQIAKILGPRGLMPNPKTETVTTNIKKAIEDLKKGKVSFKNDDTGNIHQAVGKIAWPQEKIKENVSVFIEAVKRVKPSTAKGIYVANIYLSTTFSPSLKIKA